MREDLTGKTFGSWTALSYVGNCQYLCKCVCGSEKLVRTEKLQNGTSRSCGCKHRKNIAGQRFGKLLAIEPVPGYKGNTKWRCICDCGKETIVFLNALISGNTKSCGCGKTDNGKTVINNAIVNRHLSDGTDIDKIKSSLSGRLQSNNTTGVCGVSRFRNKYAAQLTFKRKRHFLGYFDTLEEAEAARKQAEERIFGEYLQSKRENK